MKGRSLYESAFTDNGGIKFGQFKIKKMGKAIPLQASRRFPGD
jgi:hypothetical protein